MPSDFYDEITEALDEVTEGQPVDITFNGITRQGLGTAVAKSKDQETAGYLPQADAIFDLRKTYFVEMGIEERSEITVEDDVFSVLMIDIDPNDPFVRLTCKHAR